MTNEASTLRLSERECQLIEDAVVNGNIIDKVVSHCTWLKPHLLDNAYEAVNGSLVDSALRYDENCGTAFFTFAWKRAIGEVRNMCLKEKRGYMTYVPSESKIEVKLDTMEDFSYDSTYDKVNSKLDSKQFLEDLNLEERIILELYDKGCTRAEISRVLEYMAV